MQVDLVQDLSGRGRAVGLDPANVGLGHHHRYGDPGHRDFKRALTPAGDVDVPASAANRSAAVVDAFVAIDPQMT
ncbi:hypothetical protein ABTX15_32635 [Micromonospora sp. NPDC094482]|uniref:hypothetical protein n=1 Tax=unclassified Micromonospora TaxID=2617518 RepID=UPI003333D158